MLEGIEESRSSSSATRVVVAIDLGTTFSGYAYAHRAELNTVYKCYSWPDENKAGAKPYCKTQTSLYYKPTSDGKMELASWGWSALVEFTQAVRPFKSARNQAAWNLHPDTSSFAYPALACNNGSVPVEHQESSDLLLPSKWIIEKVGYFATKFKLLLAEDQYNGQRELPGGLTVETLMVDYLRRISEFILGELKRVYGKHFEKKDVQWCLTVPAIWDERAKQFMRRCTEKAGMVKGKWCPALEREHASAEPVDIILEPEAASMYCQQKLSQGVRLRKGDKLLVADVGGGTIDLVVHEKADDDPKSVRVHEAVSSYGELGGGTFVDSHFFSFLHEKVGCLKAFCRENPATALNIYGWWQRIKMGFDGGARCCYDLELPRKLSEAWEEYDRKMGNESAEDYEEVRLEEGDLRGIFDAEVDKVLALIEQQVEGVRVLMVVGGFAASPYLRKRVNERFRDRVEEVIIPDDPGSAICHGAVSLHAWKDAIQSRIAKKTYGIECSRLAMVSDPPELLFLDDEGLQFCNGVFSVFVKKGDRVPFKRSISQAFYPVYRNQRAIGLSLFSSRLNTSPSFTRDEGSTREGSFEIDISEGMHLGKNRAVEVTMCFGASLLDVTARRMNFGRDDIVEKGLTVSFNDDNVEPVDKLKHLAF